MIKCPKCGVQNPDGSNFCQQCAFKLNQPFLDTQEPRFVFNGYNGQLYVYEKKIVIKRKGILPALYQGLKGEKTIPMSEIKSIQVKKAGLTSGFIQFGISGAIENQHGAKAAKYDENSISFSNLNLNKEVEQIKAYIERLIVEAKNRQQIVQSTFSSADELLKYKSLLDDGVITQDEFEAKKRQLLGI